MYIERKFKRCDWFTFLDLLNEHLENHGKATAYFEFADELRLRHLELISEGGAFKLKKAAAILLKNIEERVASNTDFLTAEGEKELRYLLSSLT